MISVDYQPPVKFTPKKKIKDFLKENWSNILLICTVAFIIGACGFLAHNLYEFDKEEAAKQAQMTDEEKAQAYQARVANYHIASIFPYQYTDTNVYGGVMDQGILYHIIYTDDQGHTYTNDSYSGDIKIGDSDTYTVNNNIVNGAQGHLSVTLTQETASKLAIQGH